MKLSIVTICLNDLKGLKRTLGSLEEQTRSDFEQWVIDGGSTDGTPELLTGYRPAWALGWISERDGGLYDAMNKGLARSTGEYVWFLNSGDYCVDGTSVEKILAALEANPGIDMLYGRVWYESEFGRRPVGGPVSARDFDAGMPVCHQGVIYRTDLLRRRPYPTDWRLISDWIVTRDLFREGARAQFLDTFLAVYDLGGASADHWSYLREQLRYEKRLPVRLKLLCLSGGRYSLIWLSKKLAFYRLVKTWQHRRIARNSTLA